MRAYPETYFENDFCRKAASQWQKQGLLTESELAKVLSAHPEEGVRAGPSLRILKVSNKPRRGSLLKSSGQKLVSNKSRKCSLLGSSII